MPFIYKNLTEDEATAYGLVLTSSGIAYRVETDEGGCNMYVSDLDQAKAADVIAAYLAENEPTRIPAEVWPEEYGKTLSGLWVSLLLLSFHMALVMSHNAQALVQAYGSAAGPILDGEVFRTLTSLMIHASAVHLLGNMVGIALFGTAVCQVAGPGVGWFMILLSGAGGNFLNALFYGSRHLAIGSSTAVFGAVGILAAYQFLKKLRGVEGPRKSWLPLAGGLALLAFLGAGRHTDLMAHLFGFVVGIAAGVIYGYVAKGPAGKLTQVCFSLVVLFLVALSWVWGSGGAGL